MMMPQEALLVPKEVYRLIKEEVTKSQGRSVAKAKVGEEKIPIPKDSPRASPRSNFLTIRFDAGPLGITLAEVRCVLRSCENYPNQQAHLTGPRT